MSEYELKPLRVSKKSRLTRFAMDAQVYLLRRRWAGSMGDFVMVMNHVGRKTGAAYQIPVAYLRDGDDLLAVSNGQQHANWYKNVVAAGRADIELGPEKRSMNVQTIDDPEAIRTTFEHWHRDYTGFERAFRVSPAAPQELLEQARDRMVFLRLTPALA